MPTLSIDVDDFLLQEAIPVLAEHGISPADAFHAVLYAIARDQRLPFAIDSAMIVRENLNSDPEQAGSDETMRVAR